MTPEIALLLIPLLPFAAALAGYVLQNRVAPRYLAGLGALSLGISALLGLNLIALLGSGRLEGSAQFTRPWFILPDASKYYLSRGQEPGLAVPFTLDAGLAQLLFVVATGVVAACVLLYAAREREGDARAGVFHATLTLFAGSMLLFLCSDTLLVLYFAWELMGVCSYLLIGHRGTPEARRAARQAFWTTRATDFGLFFAVLAMMMSFKWATLSSIDIAQQLTLAQQYSGSTVQIKYLLGTVAVLLLLACLGKAAQLPLSFWLPDAMVAPAPVSALLHAATMVAAGPFLLIRTHILFLASDMAMSAAVLLGGVTLLLGGLMALCAGEPKRILAYSTVSQLGLVIMSIGVFAEEAGLFQLLAHAWFKAALFLAVGYLVVVELARRAADHERHSLSLEEMRGSAAGRPLLLTTLALAGLSLAGLYPSGGALGKEQVLLALLTRGSYEAQPGATLARGYPLAATCWLIGGALFFISLPVTAAYITRLVATLAVPRQEVPGAAAVRSAAGERGWGAALGAAALLALIGSIGWATYYPFFEKAFGAETRSYRWVDTFHGSGLAIFLASQALVIIAILATWVLTAGRLPQPAAAARPARRWQAALVSFFANGMYLRELFTTLVGRSGELLAILSGMAEISVLEYLTQGTGRFGRALAVAARWIDEHFVDGARYRVCQVAWLLRAGHARYWQTGQIQQYMFIILLSALALCLIALGPLARRLAEILGSL